MDHISVQNAKVAYVYMHPEFTATTFAGRARPSKPPDTCAGARLPASPEKRAVGWQRDYTKKEKSSYPSYNVDNKSTRAHAVIAPPCSALVSCCLRRPTQELGIPHPELTHEQYEERRKASAKK